MGTGWAWVVLSAGSPVQSGLLPVVLVKIWAVIGTDAANNFVGDLMKLGTDLPDHEIRNRSARSGFCSPCLSEFGYSISD